MNKMIGRPVTSEELQKVLDREEDREGFRKQLEEELKGIKRGECLLYEVKGRTGASAEIALCFLISKIAGLKMITEGDLTYVYREK